MAERTSLTERYERLTERNAELAGMTLHAAASAIHVQTVQVLTNLLAMGERFSTGKVPAPMRVMMRTLRKMEPVLIEELASVPPDAIRSFMRDLAEQIATIVDAPEGSHGNGNGSSSGQPRPAEPPPA